MSNYIAEFNTIPWETPARGIRAKSFVCGGKKLRLVEFTQGFIEPHWCIKGMSAWCCQVNWTLTSPVTLFVFQKARLC
jgi:hypothetical protein